MKIKNHQTAIGYTLAEMLIALSVGSIMLAAIIGASIGLQKSFNATDNFFATHMQQIRIIDYLTRDVKRAYIVTTSPDKKTVTCIIPTYVNGSGVRTTPTFKTTANGTVVSYPSSRTVSDAVTTSGSATLTSATALFTAGDVGTLVAGVNIPAGTTIQSVTNSTTAVLSANATASTSSATETFGAITVVYTVSGNSVVRTENGTVTNIASSTDGLLTQTSDVEQANTEYTATTITFRPIFTSVDETAGTTIFSNTYLRNKRRG